MRRAAALWSCVTLAALVVSCWDATYRCARDNQCVLAGAVGRCEADGFCSLPSDTCPSGRVYAPHSPAAGSCVPADESPDLGQPATCGNGMLDGAETCDPAIVAPNAGVCPTDADCDDHNPCTTDSVAGSAAQCSAQCKHDFVTACGPSDGCCATGCTPVSDADCSATCGNGLVDGNESCDKAIAPGQAGACPTSCMPKSACTSYALIGAASVCTARCVAMTTMTCSGALVSDGCCPPGCSLLNDGDCG
jgi:hypothetical protein